MSCGILCACLFVFVRDRFTGSIVEGCDLSKENIKGTWSRDLDLTSTVNLEWDLSGGTDGCCQCAPRKWEHEIVIVREDAQGEQTKVWSGPITGVLEDRVFGDMIIKASDRSIWWQRQKYMPRAVTFKKGTDEGIVWATIISMLDECADSGLLVIPRETGCGITEDLVLVEGQDSTQALEALTSVRWSVVEDRLLGPAPNLMGEEVLHSLTTDLDWRDNGAVVDDDGTQTATHVTVVNSEDPTLPGYVSGSWPPGPPTKHPLLGCHTLRVVDLKVTTSQQAEAAAREIQESRINGNRALVTSAGSLSENTALCIDDLVPDARVSIETSGTCNDFTEVKKINRVVGEFQLGNLNGRTCLVETRVAVDFIPINGESSATRVSV